MKRIGFFAGSFDPFTVGHLQVIKKALELFDEIIIGIAYNPSKAKRRFPVDLMKQAILETLELEGIQNRTQVVVYEAPKLTIDQAKDLNATHLIRGLRNHTDYDYEERLAEGNKKFGNYETVYFRADSDIDKISSTLVMECWAGNIDVSEYIPEPVLKVMKDLKK